MQSNSKIIMRLTLVQKNIVGVFFFGGGEDYRKPTFGRNLTGKKLRLLVVSIFCLQIDEEKFTKIHTKTVVDEKSKSSKKKL